MAVIILGSGVTPVTGTREFESVPGGSGGGDVSFFGGDANNYVLTSTGTGNSIQGEPNLTFTGTVLGVTGSIALTGASLSVSALTSAATTSIVHYNTGTGALTYAASGGGTTNFLRADGTWAAPVGSGVTKVGTPVNNELAVWTGDGTLEGESDITYDGSTLTIIAADFAVTGGAPTFAGLAAVTNTTFLNMNVSTGLVSYTTSGGGTTNFLRADGTWAVPAGTVTKVGTPADNQLGVWTGDGTIEGDAGLTFDTATNILLINGELQVEEINEYTGGQGVRIPNDVTIGADSLPTATLDIITASGSNPTLKLQNSGTGYSLDITGASESTSQRNTITDTGTTTTVRPITLVHETTNTAAAGLGAGISFGMEYDGGTVVTSGAIDSVITDAGQAGADADLSFKTVTATALTEYANLTSAGIFQVDTIDEITSAAGVTIEGVLLKDSNVAVPFGNKIILDSATSTTWIEEAVDNEIHFYTGGTSQFYITDDTNYTYNKFWPVSNGTQQLGSPDNYWSSIFGTNLYVGATGATALIDYNAGDLRFTDGSNSNITLSSLVAGTNVWTKTSTNLSPTTSGDDILLSSGERILFVDSGSYIDPIGTDQIGFVTNAGTKMSIIATNVQLHSHIISNSVGKAHDLGDGTHFFGNAYVDRLYVDDTSTYLDIAAGDMTFTDTNTGTVTLATLAAGGAGVWTKTSTTLTPTTSGDDVRLAAGEQLQFIDSNSSIGASSANQIIVFTNSSQNWQWDSSTNWTYRGLFPAGTTKTLDLGSGTYQWGDCFVDNLYADGEVISTTTFVADTGTTYTLVLTDQGRIVTLSDAAAIALTVPTNAAVAFPIGTSITVIQIGAGQVTISGAGVTLQSAGSNLKLRVQYSSATLIKSATDTWYVLGDLTA